MGTSGPSPVWRKVARLAWTAAGRYDGFWERGPNRWDIAAGVLIGARKAACRLKALSNGERYGYGGAYRCQRENSANVGRISE